ncbi:MAG: hypothetical protein WBD50_08220 [Candidatus Rhabdochlamydia sp.]
MHIAQSMTSFLISDPISFNQSLGNRCQIFCSRTPLPNILSRLIVGIIIKDITRISDIAINIIVGLAKIIICATRLIYSIPARLWGSIPNYGIGKEGLAHLGFSGFYLADMFISLTNLINRYPKDLIERVENFFSRFLPPKITNAKEQQYKTQQEEPKRIPSSSFESEVALELTVTTQKTNTDSDTPSKEESSQSQQENPLEDVMDPKESDICSSSSYVSLPSDSEADLDEPTLTTQEADSDTSAEEKTSQSIESSPFYQALLECGGNPEESKIRVANYEKFPKTFRCSTNSVY